jgi:uncharacterized protein HemY
VPAPQAAEIEDPPKSAPVEASGDTCADLGVLAKTTSKDADAFLKLGRCLAKREAYPEARQALERAAELGLGTLAFTELANVEFLDRNFDQSIARAKEALKDQPNFVPALLIEGRVFLKRGEFGKAVSILDEAYQKDPNSSEACVLLAAALKENGAINESQVQSEKCRSARRPNNWQ